MTGIDPNRYDLFYERINVSKSYWDFEHASNNTPYYFISKMW